MLFLKEEIINAFQKGIFPYVDGFQIEKGTDKEADEEKDEETDEKTDEETDEEMDTIIKPDLEICCAKKKPRRKRHKNTNTKSNA